VKASTKNWIIAILILVVLTGVFWLGYSRYPVCHPVTVTHDTIIKVDTVEHRIIDSFPYYVIRTDSIVYRDTVFRDVDTAEILKDYYAIHYYNREWKDSLLTVSLEDAITENKPLSNTFKYQILRPQEIIINTTSVTNYTKYLYIAGTFSVPDAKYSSVGVFGALPATFVGLSYVPFKKGVNVSMGFKIAKIK